MAFEAIIADTCVEMLKEIPASSSSRGRVWLFRTLGVTLIVFSVIGFLLGLIGLGGLSHLVSTPLDRAELAKFLSEAPEELRSATSALDDPTVERLFQSPRFRLFGYVMLGLGFVCNSILLYLGVLIIRGDVAAVWPFALLMSGEAAYLYGAPLLLVLFDERSDMALEFGGAWGIGNMGLSLVFLTYFWLWAPVVAILAWKFMESGESQI